MLKYYYRIIILLSTDYVLYFVRLRRYVIITSIEPVDVYTFIIPTIIDYNMVIGLVILCETCEIIDSPKFKECLN